MSRFKQQSCSHPSADRVPDEYETISVVVRARFALSWLRQDQELQSSKKVVHVSWVLILIDGLIERLVWAVFALQDRQTVPNDCYCDLSRRGQMTG